MARDLLTASRMRANRMRLRSLGWSCRRLTTKVMDYWRLNLQYRVCLGVYSQLFCQWTKRCISSPAIYYRHKCNQTSFRWTCSSSSNVQYICPAGSCCPLVSKLPPPPLYCCALESAPTVNFACLLWRPKSMTGDPVNIEIAREFTCLQTGDNTNIGNPAFVTKEASS